jgi:hypothetical protein
VGLDDAEGAGAVLQGARGITAVILEVEGFDAEVAGEWGGGCQRGPADGECRKTGVLADGKEFPISPVGSLGSAGERLSRQYSRDRGVIILDI